MRVEPPLSLPIEPATSFAATADADPPDDPPAQRAGSRGLRAGPHTDARPVVPIPSSCCWATPTTTAPASRSRANTPDAPGGSSSREVPPCAPRHGVVNMSFSVSGTPRNGPAGASASIARASSANTTGVEFSSPSRSAIRSSVASSSSPASSEPSATACACSRSPRSWGWLTARATGRGRARDRARADRPRRAPPSPARTPR